MNEQITHVRCPACRSTVKAFDAQCWVCGADLQVSKPQAPMVIDAATLDVAPAAEQGFGKIAHLAPPGMSLVPAGPLRTLNERTYFRRSTARTVAPAGPYLLAPPASARLAPPGTGQHNSAMQPLMAVAAMVFMAVAALTFAGRFAADSASAVSTVRPSQTIGIDAAAPPPPPAPVKIDAPLLAIVDTAAQSRQMPSATATTANSPTPLASTATAIPSVTPTASATASATPVDTATPVSAVADAGSAEASATIYVVRNGDTCLGIARAFGVSLADLNAANRLDNRCRLLAGQTLTVPAVNR